MGAVKDAFDSEFRDYTTAGLPASGGYEPDKQGVRSIGAKIEAAIAAAALSPDPVAALAMLQEKVDAAETAADLAEASVAPLQKTEVFGPTTPATGSSAGAASRFFNFRFPRTGTYTFSYFGLTAGGTIKLWRATKSGSQSAISSGDTFTRVGSAVSLTAATGLQNGAATIAAQAGEWLCLHIPAGAIAYQAAGGPTFLGYWTDGTTSDRGGATSVTVTTANVDFVFQFNLSITYQGVTSTAIDQVVSGTSAVVRHGLDANVARPTGYGQVSWIGYVKPLNAAPHDQITILERPYALPFAPTVAVPWRMLFWAGALDPTDPMDGIQGGFAQDWFDLSGNGYHANGIDQLNLSVADQAPAYSAAAIGGRPAMVFDGTRRFLVRRSFPRLAGPLTMIAVAKNDNLTANSQALFDGGALDASGGNSERITIHTNRAGGKLGLFAGKVLEGGAADTNPHAYYAYMGADGNGYLERDGALVAQGYAGDAGLVSLVIGKGYTNTSPFSGKIAFLAFVPEALSAADKASLMAALYSHYSIAGV